ncbi:MAG: hypothetical protein PVJ21_12205 [Anaerolineales bacterium]|jgi:hypothetical protein
MPRKKKKKNPIPLLDELEKLYEQKRPKITPKYPYDRRSDTIQLLPEIVEDPKFTLLMGNKAAAVKRVAELTGAGLRLSKDFVDGLLA